MSGDAWVDDRGGLINPYEMVRSQASALGITEEVVDENEPNDECSTATPTHLNDTASGIIAPVSDQDYFGFEAEDFWDVTIEIPSGTCPDELRFSLYRDSRLIGTNSAGPSGPVLTRSIIPGTYYIVVENRNVSIPYECFFNCYDMNLDATLTYMDPDMFDDANLFTPTDPPPPARWMACIAQRFHL